MFKIYDGTFPAYHPDYRGAHRCEPDFVDAVPQHAIVNRLWRWYTNSWYEDGFISDLPMAFQLVAEYKKYDFDFEVVRLSFESDVPRQGERFLGVDVVDKTDASLPSLLWSGLNFPDDERLSRELARFRLALNENKLFGNWVQAQGFTEFAIRLRTERGIFDPAAVYIPVGLFRVEERMGSKGTKRPFHWTK